MIFFTHLALQFVQKNQENKLKIIIFILFLALALKKKP